jgi:hypothetical protein
VTSRRKKVKPHRAVCALPDQVANGGVAAVDDPAWTGYDVVDASLELLWGQPVGLVEEAVEFDVWHAEPVGDAGGQR